MSVDLQTRWNETLRSNPEAVALIVAQTGQCWTRQELESAVTQCHAGWDGLVKKGIPGPTVLFWRHRDVSGGWRFWRFFKWRDPALLDASESDANRLAVASAIGAVALWKNGRPESDREYFGRWDRCGTGHIAEEREGYKEVALLELTAVQPGRPRCWLSLMTK